jgi:hypothetical protein
MMAHHHTMSNPILSNRSLPFMPRKTAHGVRKTSERGDWLLAMLVEALIPTLRSLHMHLALAATLGTTLCIVAAAAASEQPVIEQRADGVIVLNPEAAAFVMSEKTGRHVMNDSDPRLRIEGRRIVNTGEGFQFPGWKFRIRTPGKFAVVADLGTQRSEQTDLRLSFFQAGKESRIVATVPRKRDDTEPFFWGETGLPGGDTEALIMVWGADHPRRLPDIGAIVLVPISAHEDAHVRARDVLKTVLGSEAEGPAFVGTLSGPAPLFPTGGLDAFKPSDYSHARVIDFTVPPPSDAAERSLLFAARNSSEGLTALSLKLHAALRPDVPGLEDYYKAFEEGRHADALDGYRDYFFRKLKSPGDYGAGGIAFTDNFFQSNGKRLFLRAPQPEWVAANLAGTAVYLHNSVVLRGHVGPPGQVNWAPDMLAPPHGATFERGPDANPFWKTEDGRLLDFKIQFFRALNRHPGQGGASAVFPDLLLSYCFTGNSDHLRLYAAYWDDWAANSMRDAENCPVNVRAATELQVIGWYRTLLRTILDERPELATDFPSPTVARMMLALTTMEHPYMIRAKRAEIANWGIMGVDGALNDTKLFHEFRAMSYFNRELLRLARLNWIQHLSLDGEDLESWDEGHVAIDGMLDRAPLLALHGAPVMGDLEAQSLRDHSKTMQRTLMTHFSPDGNYWVSWLPEEPPARKTIRGKIIARGLISDVLDDPEVRSRFDATLGRVPTRRTPPLCDIQPYAMLAYLRDGFGKDSTSLVFQNFPARSQNQSWMYNGKRGHLIGSMRTQYGVAHDGRAILEASPIIVDSKPPNIFVDAIPTGGKTDFSMQTPRNVVASRFLEGSTFDVVESGHDSPFRRYHFGYGREMLGLLQSSPDEPIRGIRATRQIIHLRGENLFVVGDRVDTSGTAHDFSKFFVLPLRLPGSVASEREQLRELAETDAVLLDIDPAAKRARSMSPGLPNVSLFVAGHDYEWGGKLLGENRFATVASVSAQSLLAKPPPTDRAGQPVSIQQLVPVSVRWKGEGNQALVAAVQARPATDDSNAVTSTEIVDFQDASVAGVTAGCSFRTFSGREVWFQMAADAVADINAGPGRSRAGSLFVTRKDGVLEGIVMDARSVTLGSTPYQADSDAFAFQLGTDGTFKTEPILTPIDTIVIEPQQTIFIDTAKVSFSIPTQARDDIEFRYSLDGSDPTLESSRYDMPFELATDAIVKVRAFRKGLATTPWNIAGVEGSKTVSAIFRKAAPLPAVEIRKAEPGLNYRYFEESWPVLLAYSGMHPMLPAEDTGVSRSLLDPDHLAQIRKTDRAYSVKYDGLINVPATGVYRFFAPSPLYETTQDAGYELRVWIDGQEWFPNPDLHAENIWSAALDKGFHRFEVSYVDFRWKTFHNDYWMSWNPLQVWAGVPSLELDGPGISRQPLPATWLRHEPKD